MEVFCKLNPRFKLLEAKSARGQALPPRRECSDLLGSRGPYHLWN